MKRYAIILASGIGSRMKSDTPKQFLDLEGKPVLAHTIEPFFKSNTVDRVFVTIANDKIDYFNKEIRDKYFSNVIITVKGGKTRQESVYSALQELKKISKDKDDEVFIHDGARPLIRESDFLNLTREIKHFSGIAPMVPLQEDIIQERHGELERMFSRKGIFSIQTPMLFKFNDILHAHERAQVKGITATEETQLLVQNNMRVKLTEGSPYFYKIVYPQDIRIINELLNYRYNEDVIVSAEEAIEELKHGNPVIISDSEDRENEGDLMFPADGMDEDKMNKLIKCGGVICFCITQEIADKIGVEPMVEDNKDQSIPRFTTTIDATEKHHITSGTSAQDRSQTINVAMKKESTKGDFRQPGHVIPLIAHKDGLDGRIGHTEATTTLAKLAGFQASSVICEILTDDGNMARIPQLIEIAKRGNIKITTIDKIKEYVNEQNQKDLPK